MLSMFLWPMMLLPWYLLVWLPFYLVRNIISIFKFIALDLPKYVLFGGYDITDNAQIPWAFMFFAISSVALFAVLLVVSAFRMMRQRITDNKNAFQVVLKHTLSSWLIIYLIPLILLAFHGVVSLFSNLIADSINSTNGDLPNQIKTAIVGDSLQIDTNFNMPSFSLFTTSPYEYTIGMMKLMLTGLLLGFIFFSSAISLVRNIFDLFVLYVISPFILIGSIQDDGKRWNTWKQLYITKAIMNLTLFVGMFIFTNFIQIVMATPLPSNWDVGSVEMFKILAAAGSAFGLLSFEKIVASFLGESIGIRESMSHLQGTLRTGAMLLTGATGLASAGLTAGKLLGKGGSNMFNRIVHGSKNSISNKLKTAQKAGLIGKQDFSAMRNTLKNSGIDIKKKLANNDGGFTQEFNKKNNFDLWPNELFEYDKWKNTSKGVQYSPLEHEALQKAHTELLNSDYGKARQAHMKADELLKRRML